MVRPLGFLVGLGFIAALVFAIFTTPLKNEPNAAHEFHKHPKHLKLASDGLMPHWDQAQLQRGMQVYKEVCSACHSLNLVAFRNIADLGDLPSRPGWRRAEPRPGVMAWTDDYSDLIRAILRKKFP